MERDQMVEPRRSVEAHVPGMAEAMRARHQPAFAILEAAWSLGDACVLATERMRLPRTNMTGAPLLLFARILRALGAAITIVEQGYAHEAGAQARVAMECLFDLGYLLADPAQCEERTARFLAYEVVAAANKAELAERLGLPISPADLAAARQARQEQWTQKYGAPPNGRRGWANMTIADRAREAGLMDLYEQPYRILCDVTHNNPEAWRTLLAIDGERLAIMVGPQDGIDGVAIVTMGDVMVRAARLLADLFDLSDLSPTIEEAVAVINRAIEALDN